MMNCNKLKKESYTEYCDNRKICIAVELKNKHKNEKKNIKKKYELRNNSLKKICKIKIDDGYIKDTSVNKCDYGFFICNDNHIILVELKGKHFIEAVKQIKSTILLKRDDFEGLRVSARIVLTKMNVPNIQANPEYLKLKKIIKHYNGDIKYQTRKLSEKI